jgi:hypothetical protein
LLVDVAVDEHDCADREHRAQEERDCEASGEGAEQNSERLHGGAMVTSPRSEFGARG